MAYATRPAAVAAAAHDADCLCVPCMTADMDAALAAQGIDPGRYADGSDGADVAPERTRYARPGQRSGRGRVRLVSPRQAAYIRGLLAERDTANLVRLPGSEDVERMSLAGARDLIDRLLACPELPASRRPAAPPATPGQLAYVRRLAAERVHSEEIPDSLTKPAASAIIDRLTACPVRTADTAPAAAELVAGMYTRDGVIYKVQRAVHGSGRMYAKRAEVVRDAVRDAAGAIVTPADVSFTYAPGAVQTLTADHLMTLEQAQQFGAIYGVCCVCGRTLTDEASIAAGIGPICAGKFGAQVDAPAVEPAAPAPAPAVEPVADVAQVDADAVEPAGDVAQVEPVEPAPAAGPVFDLENLSPMARGRLRKHLDRPVRYRGRIMDHADMYAGALRKYVGEVRKGSARNPERVPEYRFVMAEDPHTFIDVPKMVYDAATFPRPAGAQVDADAEPDDGAPVASDADLAHLFGRPAQVDAEPVADTVEPEPAPAAPGAPIDAPGRVERVERVERVAEPAADVEPAAVEPVAFVSGWASLVNRAADVAQVEPDAPAVEPAAFVSGWAPIGV